MTSSSKKTYRKRSELTPQELIKARDYQRKWYKKRKAIEAVASTKEGESIDLAINFSEAAEAYEAKIASLEHQALQYRTVIDYLESKIASLQANLFNLNRKRAGAPF
jgi:predicted  nucleic acid-binding Zn-ribbon protein